MRPMRAGGGYGQFLNTRSMSFKLAIAIVVASAVEALLSKDFGAPLLALVPDHFLHALRLWQPLSYSLVAGDPFGVLFGALIVWQMGSGLETTWGPRRLLVFSLAATAAAGLLTVLLSLVFPILGVIPYTGARVLADVMWVAYGLAWGSRPIGFWGLPTTGNQFAAIALVFVVLNAIFASFAFVVPELFAIAITFVYVRYGGTRMWFTRFRAWQIQQKMKSRSKHLHVVHGDRNEVRPKDQYLN